MTASFFVLHNYSGGNLRSGKKVSKTKTEFAMKANSAFYFAQKQLPGGATDGHEPAYLNHNPGFEKALSFEH